ncbi:arylformamidase [Neobacillus sp. YIM B02564]|uniref:Kynurenine formamidase n=1 Tax=Neobacillus paridis TaxID=2803862 RepID=A0ABS1TR72_9BACI|nr:arylformamidase [Neobacillus paridis]MBL4953658.1 arylformamidase [Neobacillus paridis]
MRIFDISRKLQTGMPVWLGDTPFQYDVSSTTTGDTTVNVGSLILSAHAGTHVDAPFHFDPNGKKIIDLDPGLYVGPARVVDMTNKARIGVKELENINFDGVQRILLKTLAWKNPAQFPGEIPYLEPNLAPFLATKGVRLIGLDVPSVDPLDSEDLPAHKSLNENGIHILESVILDEVEPGDYELIALPLPLVEGDGSPVRAILRCHER